MSSLKKRVHTRCPARIEYSLIIEGKKYTGETDDISVGGAFLESITPAFEKPYIGKKGELILKISSECIQTECDIVYVGTGAGIAFRGLSNPAKDKLRRKISTLLKQLNSEEMADVIGNYGVLELLSLNLPTPKDNQEKLESYSRKALQIWLQELPLADTPKTARLLHLQIYQMTRTIMDPDHLLEAIELLRPSIYLVQESIYACHTAGITLPLSDKNQKIGGLMLSLANDLATAYYSVLVAYVEGSGKFNPKTVTMVIQRLLRAFHGILAIHYLYYLAEPEWIWLDLHTLYRLAVENKIESIKLKDDSYQQLNNISIEDTYKQILLLKLSDPYGLTPKENIEINVLFEKWSSLISLKKISKATPLQQKSCLLNLYEDQGAYWSDQCTNDGTYQFDCTPLLRLVEDYKTLANPTIGRYELKLALYEQELISLGLLNYLQSKWTTNIYTSSTRRPDAKPFVLCFGFNQIVQNLNESTSTATQGWLATPLKNSLICEFDSPQQISMGSLVSFHKIGRGKDECGLGIVEWIRMDELWSEVQFKLHVLAQKIALVNIQTLDDKAKATGPERDALIFVNSDPADKHPFNLVVDLGLKSEMIVTILSEDSYHLKLMECENIAPGYLLFHCRKISHDTLPVQTKGYDFLNRL